MTDKTVSSAAEAVKDVPDGATILVGGFGGAGHPFELLDALVDQGATDLTVVSNNAGLGEKDYGALMLKRRVKRAICSYPIAPGSFAFQDAYRAGEVELELVPQGTLAERIRAAGAGLGGVLVDTGLQTELAEGKRKVSVNGKEYLLELPLPGDFAFIRGHKGDRRGNVIYRKAARNFNPIMAMAGSLTIALVDDIVELGNIDPENVHTPGIFVDRVVERSTATREVV